MPEPITGNAEMRSRAAPIGTSVIVSVGSSLFTGLSCSLPAKPKRSTFQAVIYLALARNTMGAVSSVKGFAARGPGFFTTSNDFAESGSSSTNP